MAKTDDVYVEWLKLNAIQSEADGMNAIDAKIRNGGERRHFLLPHDEKNLVKKLEKGSSAGDGYMAMVAHNADREVVGYALYTPLKDHTIELLKVEIDPDYEDIELRKSLVYSMARKIDHVHIRKLVAHAHVDDVDMQRALTVAGFKTSKNAIKKNYYPQGGSAVAMELMSPELRVEQQHAASAAEPKDRKELLQAMLRQLEAMTGRAWEAAMPDEAGRLVKTDVMYTNCESKDLHFRTCEDIAAPAAARAAIYNYLGTATVRGYLASVNKPSPVAFPASLVRRAHLKPGQEGVLSQAFGAVSEPGKNGGNPPEGVGRA